MSVSGEIHNVYNLYITENTVTVVPRGNFTKATNNFWYIEQRNNTSAEETLKTAYYKSKDTCKNLKTDWLKIHRTQIGT